MVTDEMIDAAWSVLREEINPPYMARVDDYVTDDSTGMERVMELAALRAADKDAERQNRDLVRRAITAALEAQVMR